LIVVIPARGGSKRLPRKNIKPLGGKPLLAYTIEAALGAGIGVPVIVSTEDDEIAAVARDFGAEVVIRPAELAADDSSTEATLLHVLDARRRDGSDAAWVMTLPPTAPFRSAATVRRFHDAARDGAENIDCYMSVTEDRGDFWQLAADGTGRRLFPDAPRRQQSRAPLYEENSAVYVTRVRALRQSGSILGDTVMPLAIDPLEALDINTAHDFWLAESLILNAGARPGA
jgi:CMP-N,N'-diacetyllegionaminic acid synthase